MPLCRWPGTCDSTWKREPCLERPALHHAQHVRARQRVGRELVRRHLVALAAFLMQPDPPPFAGRVAGIDADVGMAETCADVEHMSAMIGFQDGRVAAPQPHRLKKLVSTVNGL